jgi:hypothetical protein
LTAGDNMKLCTKCNLEKDDDFFNKNQVWCKVCYTEYKKQYDIINRENNKKYRKHYRIDNLDSEKQYLRLYRQNNKESVAKK